MNDSPTAIRDVVIVGSGPAGYTAAIYAARAGLRPLVLEGFAAGGALMNTTDVENFPGFRDGVLGPDLMAGLRTQATRFGAELRREDAISVDLARDRKRVTTANDEYVARTVIVATGSEHKTLGLPDEARLTGRGVSTCATCDGFFFRDHDIAVVGGGDTALEEAIFLSRIARSVTVIHRRDRLRASKVMQDRAFAEDKIRFLWGSQVVAIAGDDRVTGLQLRTSDGRDSKIDVSGLFVAVGHQPRSDLFAGQLDRDSDGYLAVLHPTTATNLPGVFAAGDVVDRQYRQAVTAAGSGCMAAIDAERFLSTTPTGAGVAPAPVGATVSANGGRTS